MANEEPPPPKYEDVIKTTSFDSMDPDDVHVTFTYAESARSSNSDRYVDEFEIVRNNSYVHVSVGYTNHACQEQSSTTPPTSNVQVI